MSQQFFRLIGSCVTSAFALAGCAANSGVVPSGSGTYIVSRQAATGFSGLGTLKDDALREADAYCNSQRRMMVVLEATQSQPPYVLGNYPRAEVHFRCDTSIP